MRMIGERFVVLAAYLDESYDQEVFALAGFLSYEEVWRTVEKQWKRVLRDNDIERFHAADCSSGFGEFRGWTAKRRTGLMKRLLRSLIRPEMYCLSFGVVVPASKELFRAKRNDDFYPACLQTCMEVIAKKTVLLPAGERVSIIADRSRFAAKGMKVFDMMTSKREIVGARFKSITFASWEDFTPLQCADLMAYEAFKMLRRQEVERERPERKSYAVLSSGLPILGGYFDRESLLQLRDAIAADESE